jgi:hypothetical protein
MLGIDILAIAALCWVVGHAVNDITHAVRGTTPPRIAYRNERAAAREARTGKPSRKASTAPSAFRRYWADLWADAWTDAHTRRADRHADRKAAYTLALAAGQPAREAAREAAFGPAARVQTAAAEFRASIKPQEAPTEVPPAPTSGSTVEIEFDHGGPEEEMRIACGECGDTLTEIAGTWKHPAGSDCIEATPTNITIEGTPAMTGEAINYETTLAAYEHMITQLQTVGDRLNGIDTAITEMHATAEQITAAGAVFNLTAGALDGAQDVQDHLDADEIHNLMTRVDSAIVGVSAARDHLIAAYGDAADVMATTGTDGAFVNA